MYNRSRVDELLLELADYKNLVVNFGDEDGEYQKRIETLEYTISFITKKED